MSIHAADPAKLGALEELSHVASSKKELDLKNTNPSLNNTLQLSAENKAERERLGSNFTTENATNGDLRTAPESQVDLVLGDIGDVVDLQASAARVKNSVTLDSNVVGVWAKAKQEASDRIAPIR